LDWETPGGAKSLGVSDRLETFSPGMRADIVAVRANDRTIRGSMPPDFALTQVAKPQNGDFVMIGGAVHKSYRAGLSIYCRAGTVGPNAQDGSAPSGAKRIHKTPS
jgi:cytosine/adenosine deaminase-related metal-dependent hydrolase